MRKVLVASFVGLIFAVPGNAQNTRCQWIAGVWTCQGQRSVQPIDPGAVMRSGYDAIPSYNDTLIKERQAELLKAQADEIRARSAAARQNVVPPASQIDEIQSRITSMRQAAWEKCRGQWNEAIEKRDFELADSLAKGCPAAP